MDRKQSKTNIAFKAWDKRSRVMCDDPGELYIYICEQHPDRYVLMQYTGLNDKNGQRVFAKYDVLSRTLDDGSEHRDTIELGWSRDGQYGYVWSTSRAIVTEQDAIDKRYEIIGNGLESPELLAGVGSHDD